VRSLRRHQDVVSLVASWALLLQALIGPLLPSQMSSEPGLVMCTAKGAVAAGKSLPKQHKPNCPCCTFACRVGHGGTAAGILPEAARVAPPALAAIFKLGPRLDVPALRRSEYSAARPRGPPAA
jgi:hypothetical protein